MKKRNGEFIGSSAPYGYLKDPNDKHKFIVDVEASYTVKKIFNMILIGKSRKEIAEHLNEKEILTPNLYKIEKKNIGNKQDVVSNKWNAEIVTRILGNGEYTGTLIQGVKKKLNYRTDKLIDVNKDDWIITENHHKAIITKEKFYEVQKILDRKKGYYNSKDMLAGLLKCADCGKSMTIKKSKDKEYYYCTSFVRNGNCTNHSIKKQDLLHEIISQINKHLKNNKIDSLTIDLINKYIDKIIIFKNKKVQVVFKNN